MIVGDSISQGAEGDYTWRYRLSRHLAQQDVTARFVGPWNGTWVDEESGPGHLPGPAPEPAGFAWHPVGAPAEPAGAAHAASRPGPVRPAGTALAAEPVRGGYQPGVLFDDNHYARWGRLMREAKEGIGGAVAACRPDYLMVALGFNDLAWGVSDPRELLADAVAFVSRAREANPRVQFLFANVVHRTPLADNPHLGDVIAWYNRSLPGALAALSTRRSRIALVDLAALYEPYSDAYDGLHPNGVGEIKIARAFAGVFWSVFDHGRPRRARPRGGLPPRWWPL
ncbi:GDSL-type esterase/lipase family protein [Sphaerisporangium sp. TRM90804]|uniref:GDSL-type esterase/lipase family protein n=1 Tax=Sphaerisporangium sp. TRM90804 TaxID=3031113 RepID=UPI00244870AB|nr:GDSL-type esterase/lipase family protein [Sphaerisporangium sp. TRM90804]MDH2424468.1 GDSL-type esterase/lipase family protein [Sphaerisporangium sp. TRM90804]